MLSIVAAYFCGCNFHFIADGKIKDSVIEYWSGLRSEDIELQNAHTENHAGGFSADSIGLSSYEEISLESALLEQTYCNFETDKEIEIKGNEATVTINVITFDYITAQRRPKQLDSLIKDLNLIGTTTVPMTISLIKVDKEWLIKTESVNAIKEYFKSIPEGFEFYGVPEAMAIDCVQNIITAFINKDAENALYYRALEEIVHTYPEELQDRILDSYLTIFKAYFDTANDISYEVVDSDDTTTFVRMSCQIVDADSAWNSFYDNEEEFLNLITESYRYIYGAEGYDVATYSENYAEASKYAFEACSQRTDFSRVFPVTRNEDGEMEVYLNDMLMPDSGFYMSTDNESFMNLRQSALDVLLEEGTITSRQYNEALGVVSSVLEGVDFSYTENDSIYSCTYSIVDNMIIRINIVTWVYYEQGTEFTYDVYRNDELVLEDATYTIPTNNCDEIYSEYLVDAQSEEEWFGNYRFVVYENGEELVTVTLIIREDDGSDELVIPDFPSEVTTGESMTFEGDRTTDIYYVHFEDLHNDQPIAFNSGDEGFDVYVCTWGYYNEGDCFVYAVYRDGVLVSEDGRAYISEREGLDRIELIYAPEGGLEVGNYTIILYNLNSTDILLEAYLTVD